MAAKFAELKNDDTSDSDERAPTFDEDWDGKQGAIAGLVPLLSKPAAKHGV
jgi:hypothetical protein